MVDDIVEARIKGRSVLGRVTEICDGIVYFRPISPAAGWRHASAREIVAHWRKTGAGIDGRPGVDEPAARDMPRPTTTADVGERSDSSPVGQPRSPRPYDLAAVCPEQALVCPVNGSRCESIAGVDVGCAAQDADVDAGRAA